MLRKAVSVIRFQFIEQFGRLFVRERFDDQLLFFSADELEGPRGMFDVEVLEKFARPVGVAVGKFRNILRTEFIQFNGFDNLVILQEILDVRSDSA